MYLDEESKNFKYDMEYGIYTIQSENEIPKELIEDKYTFYVKINGRDIKDYDFDYMDIMQNAFLFHTKDCVGWRDRYLDWMCDKEWQLLMQQGQTLSFKTPFLFTTNQCRILQ